MIAALLRYIWVVATEESPRGHYLTLRSRTDPPSRQVRFGTVLIGRRVCTGAELRIPADCSSGINRGANSRGRPSRHGSAWMKAL